MRCLDVALALAVASCAPRLVAGYTPPRPSLSSLRYPVGYDPDHRERPRYFPSPDALLPRPEVRPTTLPTTRPTTRGEARRARWEPPTGYVPRSQRAAPAGHGAERAAFVNDEPPDYSDGRVRLCTGIWMGRVILHKHCVALDRDELTR